MKQSTLLRFLAAVALAFSATTSYAYDFEVNGIYYQKNSDGISVSVTYKDPDTSYAGAVVIPAKVTYSGATYAVTGINDYAFSDCERSTSVTIPNSVTQIGEQVFNFSSGIEGITVENGNPVFDSRDNCNAIIKTATNSLLYGCKNTTLPDDITSIGVCAFCGCTGLTSVTIPNGVTSIGEDAFGFCDNLATVSVPESVIRIGDGAFAYTPFEESLPSGLAYLGKVLYKYIGWISSNTSITIKEGTVSIADSAFFSKSGLASVTMPNSLTYIGKNAFSYCSGLTTVNFGNSVNTIDYKAFSECTALTSVTLPNSVTEIADEAFYECTNLATVNVSDNLAHIGFFAFYNTPFDNNLPEGANYLGKCLYNYKGSMPANTNFVVKDGTKQVCYAAFAEYNNLVSVTIPNSVAEISSEAFYECANLKSAVIGDGARSISQACFYGCENLESVKFGSSVSDIYLYAFVGCSKLSTIYSGATVPPTILGDDSDDYAKTAFYGLDKSAITVYVPEGSVDAYRQAHVWKEFQYIYGGNEDVAIDNCATYTIDGRVLHCGGVNTDVYTFSGVKVYSGCGEVELATGAYIVVAEGRATKAVVK